MAETIQKHYRVCNLCEAMCGLQVEHDGKKVISIKGDQKDPLSQGSICPKGALMHQLHEDPNRLKKPMRKKQNGEWEEIGWTEALDIVGEKINDIRSKHGDNAVGLYLGNPTVHNFGMMMMLGELRKSLNTQNVFSPSSMDQLPHHFLGYFMFGHPYNIPIPDIDRTEYMIMIGANPIASNGSMMSAPGVHRRLLDIQKRGGKIIQFDPRENETSRVVDEHYFIKPSTDVYLLLGMLHLIQKNNWIDLKHLKGHTTGLEQLKGIANEFTPAKVSVITGIPQEIIERVTRDYVLEEKAVLYGRMGMSTQEHGGMCNWLAGVINILTGHFDKEGGAMFTNAAFNIKRSNKFKVEYDRWKSRVSNIPEFEGELPVSVMAEEMTTEGKGQIKALVTYAGNPALSSPNGKRLDDALDKLGFVVCIDIFLNETTKYADIILPPPSHLEIEHYDVIFNNFAASDNAKFSPALFEPEKNQMYDWQIAKELTKRFSKVSSNTPSKLFQWLTPKQLLNLGLMIGPYGKLSHPKRWFSGLSLKKVIASEHGIALGALKTQVPKILRTTSDKVDLAPEIFLKGLKAVKEEFKNHPYAKLDPEDFLLIGRRHLRSCNSWMHNVPGLTKGKNRCTVMMNPIDATRLSLTENETVKVTSRVGKIELPVEITNHIMSGVLSIPHGFGHTKEGTQLDIASKPENAGVSLNDITDQRRMDPVTGNAAFSGQVVSVSKHTKETVS